MWLAEVLALDRGIFNLVFACLSTFNLVSNLLNLVCGFNWRSVLVRCASFVGEGGEICAHITFSCGGLERCAMGVERIGAEYSLLVRTASTDAAVPNSATRIWGAGVDWLSFARASRPPQLQWAGVSR